MDNRERITRLARGESVDRKPLFFYFGPWGETIERWRREGAKIEDGPEGFQRAFRLDRGIAILPLNQGYAPAFEEAILEDRGDRVLFRDGRGITQLIRRDGASIPQFLDFPGRRDVRSLQTASCPPLPGAGPRRRPPPAPRAA